MKKKKLSKQDKKIWKLFTQNLTNIYDKDDHSTNVGVSANISKKIDLHGLSLDEANTQVKKFINTSFQNNLEKILVITGKGLRSKAKDDPYKSISMSILKNSVPDFINNDKELSSKILKIRSADIKDGGDGAFYIFLKSKKKL